MNDKPQYATAAEDPEINLELQDYAEPYTNQYGMFKSGFNDVMNATYCLAKRNGFWPEDFEPGQCTQEKGAEKIALIHGELSEGLEGLRHGNPPDDHIPDFTSLEAELADAIIRIMDLAKATNSRLAEAIIAKHQYNMTRPFRHGKNF